MPARSRIYKLPPKVREELDKRLVDNAFGSYQQLSDWLQGKGYNISRCIVAVYGKNLKTEFKRTMESVRQTQQLANAFEEANSDERGALVAATATIAQDSLLRIIMALRDSEQDPVKLAKSIPDISRALGELGRLSISREKWVMELRAKDRADAADRAEVAGRKKGVSKEAIQAMRAAILEAM